jgi:hypothetical protein
MPFVQTQGDTKAPWNSTKLAPRSNQGYVHFIGIGENVHFKTKFTIARYSGIIVLADPMIF